MRMMLKLEEHRATYGAREDCWPQGSPFMGFHRPPKKGDRSFMLEDVLDNTGLPTGERVQVALIYNGRRWVNYNQN